MEGQNTTNLDGLDHFPPTVNDSTSYKGGYRLHTIDKSAESDIEIFDDERPAQLVGDLEEN